MTDFIDDELRLNFADVGDVEPIELIPSGMQHLIITDAEIVKAGENAQFPGGPVISMELTVADGEYEGRKVWDRMAVAKEALRDEKGEAKFGFKKLKSLLGALGYDPEGDLTFKVTDWIDQHVDGQIGRKNASVNRTTGEEYAAKNTVVRYAPHEMTEEEALR